MPAKKRERESDGPSLADDDSTTAGSPTTAGASTTNFRNVSACNRCRNRKNRCDQKLPKCTNCEKANVRCVGFDPVSKREIPRSYVYYLETRVNNLEAILNSHNISFPPPSQDFAISESIKPGINVPFPIQDEANTPPQVIRSAPSQDNNLTLDPALKEHDEGEKLNKLVNDVGMVSVQGSSDSRLLGAASGISFARVVFAAVKKSTNQATTPSDKGGSKTSKGLASEAASGPTSMRDSFFGLHTKPTIKPAPFPEKELGARLVDLYFEHANPQIPTLHRGEFMSLFDRVYATDAKKRTPRELYMLNIVFAIGSGIIVDTSSIEQSVAATESTDSGQPNKKRQKFSNYQHQPEQYHSSAIIHLESFLGSSPAAEGVGGGLEELQAVLLLAGLALLRPVAPGLWYIIGVAVRLSIDLGLHFEDIDHDLDARATHPDVDMSNQSLGRKQWTRDLRRRLWWCVFNLDRLVSSCVGRPVAVNEAVVTTEFPSLLDDKYITPAGFLKPPNSIERLSYKLVTRQYIRLRLLQSEILQVLQHRQAESARRMGANSNNEFIPTGLESPYLRPFRSFREWRVNIDRRLLEWKESSPNQWDTGVGFNPLFLELNYWQAVIMLYRQSLSVPEQLASELSPATGDDVQSPGNVNFEHEEDKQMVFIKVAEAGQMVLRIYRQLHRLKLVNYTFLATHHLFMSGKYIVLICHLALDTCTIADDHR
ncbi:Positive regulator of purine utilization [Pseudocercospora fuligena]|uniref:Positive regulator of purine utilization n=1 Tax=Pseudocercospora fuligena TaxID=685502 RepID=A0A8H6RC54_9PEZI|nr:Positive regulator of purine utilization [Pseudocercospora fuligena]